MRMEVSKIGSLYHVSLRGIQPGTVLKPDYHQLRKRVSVFCRACCQGPEVFAASLIGAEYADEIAQIRGPRAPKWACEGLFEYVRITERYPRPARCDSLFMFETSDLATAFISKCRDADYAIYECEPAADAVVYVTDMLLFDEANDLLIKSEVDCVATIAHRLDDMKQLARQYWDAPLKPRVPEILVLGEAVVRIQI